ncbi:MAG: hypothetical protein ACLFVX_02865 [Archaeoglobaceae archaeon]
MAEEILQQVGGTPPKLVIPFSPETYKEYKRSKEDEVLIHVHRVLNTRGEERLKIDRKVRASLTMGVSVFIPPDLIQEFGIKSGDFIEVTLLKWYQKEIVEEDGIEEENEVEQEVYPSETKHYIDPRMVKG